MADFAYSVVFFFWPKDFKHLNIKNFQNLDNVAGMHPSVKTKSVFLHYNVTLVYTAYHFYKQMNDR